MEYNRALVAEANGCQKWEILCASACAAAVKVLKRTSSPRDFAVRTAHAELQRQLQSVNQRRVIDLTADYTDTSDHPPNLLPGVITN